MVQRNMSDSFFKQEKSEEDLSIIISSLKKARAKYNEKTLVISKNDLTYKIIDNLTVSRAKAVEYIMILQSRGVITIDKDIIYFSPKEDKQLEIEAKKEIENYLKSSEIKQEIQNDK